MSLTSSVQPNFLPSRFHGQGIYQSFIGNIRDIGCERPTLLEAGNAAQV
jgi:hypothetical protein